MKLIKFIAIFLLCLTQTFQKRTKDGSHIFDDNTGNRRAECLGHEGRAFNVPVKNSDRILRFRYHGCTYDTRFNAFRNPKNYWECTCHISHVRRLRK